MGGVQHAPAPDLSTLAARMLYAATVVSELNDTYSDIYSADATWRPSELIREAGLYPNIVPVQHRIHFRADRSGPAMTDIVDRAMAALAGITPGPWTHHTAPSDDSDETHAEYLAGSLIGDGEPLHVLTAPSPDPKFAYIVPAVTGDGRASAINAEFIAAAPELVRELVAKVERLSSYKSLPMGMVWQDYYSPDDVCKIREPLDAEIERLQPRIIRTVEELDALPERAVIRDRGGRVFEKTTDWLCGVTGYHSWWSEVGEEGESSSDELDDLPARVLFNPGQEADRG